MRLPLLLLPSNNVLDSFVFDFFFQIKKIAIDAVERTMAKVTLAKSTM